MKETGMKWVSSLDKYVTLNWTEYLTSNIAFSSSSW